MRRIIKMYDEMKRFLIVLCALVCIPVFALAKDVKISVTPSDAKIYIDGNYVGDGVGLSAEGEAEVNFDDFEIIQ